MTERIAQATAPVTVSTNATHTTWAVTAATETAVGVVELATTAEATTGTDTTRATTAAGVKAVVDAHVAAGDPHPGYLTAAEGNAAYQPLDADLTDIAAIADVQGDIIIRGASGWERLAKSGTSTDVLTAGATKPEWTAPAGGGGGDGGGLVFQLASSYVPASVYDASFLNNTYSADEVHFIPLILGAAATADRIGISVHTAVAAGKVARLGIYNTANGRPTTVLLNAGTVAVDSTGVKEITISQALAAGTLYALCVHIEQASTQLHTFMGQAAANALFDYQTRSVYASQAFASGLPASPTLLSNGKNPPLIRVRLS